MCVCRCRLTNKKSLWFIPLSKANAPIAPSSPFQRTRSNAQKPYAIHVNTDRTKWVNVSRRITNTLSLCLSLSLFLTLPVSFALNHFKRPFFFLWSRHKLQTIKILTETKPEQRREWQKSSCACKYADILADLIRSHSHRLSFFAHFVIFWKKKFHLCKKYIICKLVEFECDTKTFGKQKKKQFTTIDNDKTNNKKNSHQLDRQKAKKKKM